MAVNLMIDAGCDLSQTQAEDMGVILIPMTIHFGNEEYRAGVDITAGEFYKKLAESGTLPTTSQPTPFAFEEAFQKAQDAGQETVVLCMSSALSGTYQSASIAAAGFDKGIYVIDTQAVSVAQWILLDYAIQLRAQGLEAHEIAQEIENKKHAVCAYAAVDTLEYLIKGGRLSKAAGAVGSVLGIRPILHLNEGALVVAAKARGPKGAVTMVNSLIKEAGVDFDMPFRAGYTGNDAGVTDPYLQAANAPWQDSTVRISQVGSTVGTHTGPGLFIAAFFRKS